MSPEFRYAVPQDNSRHFNVGHEEEHDHSKACQAAKDVHHTIPEEAAPPWTPCSHGRPWPTQEAACQVAVVLWVGKSSGGMT